MSAPSGRKAFPPVVVRPFLGADRSGVRSLLKSTFGSSEIFDSFEHGNPVGEIVAVVAEQEGRVVGFNMWNAWLLRNGAEAVTAYQSGASAVDLSMRGQGVFGRLLRAGEDLARSRGVRLLFGFPNPASTEAFLKVGWSRVGTMRQYACLVPAIGHRSSLGLPGDPSNPGLGGANATALRAFSDWRYSRSAGIMASTISTGGRPVTIYCRTAARFGLKIHKLLDVVAPDGSRVQDGLASLVSSLPGPGVVLLRASPSPRGSFSWLPVRRRWDTPVILKDLRPDSISGPADLAATPFWYGDIDVC